MENCATVFEIDVGMIGPIIKMRNEFYHGDRKKKDKLDSDIDLAVTRLIYICE